MEKARILVIGAHPDDCELNLGGTAALWALHGCAVRFVSCTNGDTGHYSEGGAPLARRRREEAARAAAVIGIESQVLDIHSGELMPTLENRREIIRIIRSFGPDLIVTHRPNDYHPDHRYTSQLVQDAAYVVTVPGNTALTDALEKNPVIAYMPDRFQKPYPFTPDIAIDISETVETKIDMIHAHASQMYEWLPYHDGRLHEVPQSEPERREWLAARMRARLFPSAERFRSLLARIYGDERAKECIAAEALEICEYGGRLTPELRRKIFPFLPEPPAA